MSAESTPAVRIVLVETTHPGNIGAAARAMKSMGLADLALVRPQKFPSAEATARASGADDLLVGAKICDSLTEAVGDCVLVAATSARERHLDWPRYTPWQCAEEVDKACANAPVAIVFGPEHSGLSNEHLDACNALVRIPTSAQFASLNVAAAVQIFAYEICKRRHLNDVTHPQPSATRSRVARRLQPATFDELQGVYQHLEQVLTESGYFDPAAPRLLRRRIRRFFSRARPDRSEVRIIRGILSSIENKISSASGSN